MACKIEVEVLTEKAAKALMSKFSGQKQLRYNNYAITTALFGDTGSKLQEAFVAMFNPEAFESIDIEETFNESFTGVDENTPDRLDIKQKTNAVVTNNGDIRDILQILNKDGKKTVEELVTAAITMRELLDSLDSEKDVQKNSYLSKEEKDKLNKGGIPVSLARLAPSIGRKLATARGIRRKGGLVHNHAYYDKIGRDALKQMAAEGLIEIDESATAKWLAGNAKKVNGNDTTQVLKGPVARVNAQAFADFKVANDVTTHTPAELLGALKQIDRLISPYKEIPVEGEKSDTAFTASNMAQDAATKETIKKVQEGAFVVAPAIESLMQSLHAEYIKTDGGKAFETALKDKYGTASIPIIEEMFGLTPYNDTIFKDSELGKKVGRMAPLVALMQHYNVVGDSKEFFLTYNQAHNSRFFQREDMLNVQSDKKMSRNLLESGEEFEFSGKKEIDNFVRRVATEFGIPMDVITGKEKGTPEFEQMLEELEANTADDQVSIMFRAADDIKGNKTGIKGKTPWAHHKAIRAISDIRKGHAKGKVKSRVLLESDAVGSGPVLKMLQSTNQDKVATILKRMGLLPKTAQEEQDLKPLEDFYELASDHFDVLAGKTQVHIKSQVKKVQDIMKITGTEADFRTFIKDVIIRFTYEQTTKSNMKETADVLAEKILRGGIASINDTIKALDIQNPKKPGQISTDTVQHAGYDVNKGMTISQQQEAFNMIAKAIETSVAGFLVKDVLNPVYSEGMFDSNKKTIDDIFKLIQKKIQIPVRDNGISFKFMQPSAVLNWLDEYKGDPNITVDDFPYHEYAKHRLIGDKKFETAMENGKGENILVTMYHPNSPSAHILPIHAMDAAILLRAVKTMYETLSKDPKLNGKTPKQMAVMLIHDAGYLSPKIAYALEEAYEQEIINASVNYDVVNMMLREAAYKYSLQLHEAAKKKNPNAEYEPLSLEQFAILVPAFEKHITASIKNTKAKTALLNVNANGDPRNKNEPYKVIEHSFAPDLGDPAMAKVKEAYDKRIEKKSKSTDSKPTPDPVPEAEVDNYSNKELPTFEGTPDDKDIKTIADIIEGPNKDNVVVADTETTGKDPSHPDTVVHQIAFSEGINGKVKVINLFIDEDAELAEGFQEFYERVTPDLDYKDKGDKDPIIAKANRKKAIIAHINAKATASKATNKKHFNRFKKMIRDNPLVFHNKAYDIEVLNKIDDNGLKQVLQDKGQDILDSLAMANYTRRAAVVQKASDEGKTETKYVKDVLSQEALEKHYDVENKGAHTADGDVGALQELLKKMSEDYRTVPTGYRQDGQTGEQVFDYALGELVLKEDPSKMSVESKRKYILEDLVVNNPAAAAAIGKAAKQDVIDGTTKANDMLDALISCI